LKFSGKSADLDYIDVLNAQLSKAGAVITKQRGLYSRKLSEIAFCSYDVFLPAASPALIPAIQTALKGELTVQKKNKKGKIVEKNLSPGMQSVSVSERDGGIFLQAVLSAAGEEYLKPEALLQALAEQLPSLDQGRKRILRTQVYSADMTAFYDNQNQSLKG